MFKLFSNYKNQQSKNALFEYKKKTSKHPKVLGHNLLERNKHDTALVKVIFQLIITRLYIERN